MPDLHEPAPDLFRDVKIGARSAARRDDLAPDFVHGGVAHEVGPILGAAGFTFAEAREEALEVRSPEAPVATGRLHAWEQVLVRPALDAGASDSRDARRFRGRQEVVIGHLRPSPVSAALERRRSSLACRRNTPAGDPRWSARAESHPTPA